MAKQLNLSGEETKGIELRHVSHIDINLESVSSRQLHLEAEPLLLKVKNQQSIINSQSTELI